MRKIILPLTLILSFLCQSAAAQANEKWLQDYEAMKKFMSEAYANLEWARKKIHLAALDKKTKEELTKAASDTESRSILEEFLRAFRDGHLHLRENAASVSAQNNDQPPAFAPDAPAAKVCSELGYKVRLHRFSLPFDKAPDFKSVSTEKDYFPAGVFRLENGKSYAVLNIGLFSADRYLGNCIESWEEFRAKLNTPCAGDCLRQFYDATNNRLSAKLTEQIRVLQEQKPDYLIVDIGGNGGGSNWVEAAARIVSPKLLKSTLSGFIRHPHHVAILEEKLKVVEDDLARKDLNAKQIGYLKTAKARLEKYIKEAKAPCDRSYFWTSAGSGSSSGEKKNCTLLNTTPSFASGIFDRLPSNEISNLRSKNILFQPVDFKYEESVFKGNLIVLVDRKTASAAENFASFMQSSKSGEVVGEKTLGAGCGYINGGTKYFLPNSKLQLRMPDCVRYRADGVNEVEGVEPDVSLWEANDDKPKKLEKLLTYLSKRNRQSN